MINRHYSIVSTLCVFLSIGFFSFLSNFLTPQLSSVAWLAPIISITATVGFYVSIYQTLMWFYFQFLADFFNREEAISGEWFYHLVINNQPENSRYGICMFDKEGLTSLRLSGVHYHPVQRKFTSHFFSVFIEVQRRNILVMYDARGLGSKLDSTRGMYFMQSVGTPPHTIHGVWADVLPSKNAGSITLVRRSKDTDELMEKIGLPKDTAETARLINFYGVQPIDNTGSVVSNKGESESPNKGFL